MPEIPAWWPQRWLAALPEHDDDRQLCLRALHDLAREVDDPAQHLSQAVDASRHPLSQWCCALADCLRYAHDQDLQIPISSILDYLSGASLCKEAELGWQLRDLFAACVEQYGFIK